MNILIFMAQERSCAVARKQLVLAKSSGEMNPQEEDAVVNRSSVIKGERGRGRSLKGELLS